MKNIIKKLTALRDYYAMVYNSLSIEEKNVLKQSEKDKTCLNCTNGCCNVSVTDMTNEVVSCYGWENPHMLGEKIVRKRKRK